MVINSLNIIGITGGVGYQFFLKCKKHEHLKNICGQYFSNVFLANDIKANYPEVELLKADLSITQPQNYQLPNYEGIAFFVGETFFSANIFDAKSNDLIRQLNLHTNSVLKIIFELLEFNQSNLKKIIILCSYVPEKINTVYHLSKKIIEEAIKLLLPSLIEKGVSVSLIYSGWIDTKMYQEYRRSNFNATSSVLSAEYVAKICYNELNTDEPLNIIKL